MRNTVKGPLKRFSSVLQWSLETLERQIKTRVFKWKRQRPMYLDFSSLVLRPKKRRVLSSQSCQLIVFSPACECLAMWWITLVRPSYGGQTKRMISFLKRDSSSVLTKDSVNPRRNVKRIHTHLTRLVLIYFKENPCAAASGEPLKSTRAISRKPWNKVPRNVTLDLPHNERSNHISTEMRKLVWQAEMHNILTFKSFPSDITGKCTERNLTISFTLHWTL